MQRPRSAIWAAVPGLLVHGFNCRVWEQFVRLRSFGREEILVRAVINDAKCMNDFQLNFFPFFLSSIVFQHHVAYDLKSQLYL